MVKKKKKKKKREKTSPAKTCFFIFFFIGCLSYVAYKQNSLISQWCFSSPGGAAVSEGRRVVSAIDACAMKRFRQFVSFSR